MSQKSLIRKKIFSKKKKKYFQIKEKFFNLIRLLKKKKKTISNISIYYPSFYEVDVLKNIDLKFFNKDKFSFTKNKKEQFSRFFQMEKIIL